MNKVVAVGMRQRGTRYKHLESSRSRLLGAHDAWQVRGLGGGGEGGLEMLQGAWEPAGGEAVPVWAWFPTLLLPGLLCALEPTPGPPWVTGSSEPAWLFSPMLEHPLGPGPGREGDAGRHGGFYSLLRAAKEAFGSPKSTVRRGWERGAGPAQIPKGVCA